MNNIIYHNIIRKMEKKIEEEKRETEEVIKNGYPCTEDCWIRRLDSQITRKDMKHCGSRKLCDWDLRSNFWKKGGVTDTGEAYPTPLVRDRSKKKMRRKKFH